MSHRGRVFGRYLCTTVFVSNAGGFLDYARNDNGFVWIYKVNSPHSLLGSLTLTLVPPSSDGKASIRSRFNVISTEGVAVAEKSPAVVSRVRACY